MVRMKAASDSSEQSSDTPLIAQEVWRSAIALSSSLISYQTHGGNKFSSPFPWQQNYREVDDLWGCGHRFICVTNSSEVCASGCMFSISRERGSGGAVFPAQGQRAVSKKEGSDKDRWRRKVTRDVLLCWIHVDCTHTLTLYTGTHTRRWVPVIYKTTLVYWLNWMWSYCNFQSNCWALRTWQHHKPLSEKQTCILSSIQCFLEGHDSKKNKYILPHQCLIIDKSLGSHIKYLIVTEFIC